MPESFMEYSTSIQRLPDAETEQKRTTEAPGGPSTAPGRIAGNAGEQRRERPSERASSVAAGHAMQKQGRPTATKDESSREPDRQRHDAAQSWRAVGKGSWRASKTERQLQPRQIARPSPRSFESRSFAASNGSSVLEGTGDERETQDVHDEAAN